MSTPLMERPAADLPFGQALREVRGSRKLSQLGLSVEAGISQRHISFLESGRARPSRSMVLQLSECLALPLRIRNRLLMSAGFAPIYAQRPLDNPDMGQIRQALQRLLTHHEPFPAFVVDRAWDLLMSNAAADRVVALLGEPAQVWQRVCGAAPPNMFKLTFHPEGMRPLILNIAELGPALLARARLEALEDSAVARLLETVLAYPGIPARWKVAEPVLHPPPVMPIKMQLGDARLNFFTMLGSFGTPQDLTTDTLRLEHMFPADAESEALLRRLAAPL